MGETPTSWESLRLIKKLGKEVHSLEETGNYLNGSYSSQNSKQMLHKIQDNEVCNFVNLHQASWRDGDSTVQGIWKLQQLLCWIPGCREFLLLLGSWLLFSIPDISRIPKTMISENLVCFSAQCCECWNIPIEFQQDFLMKKYSAGISAF